MKTHNESLHWIFTLSRSVINSGDRINSGDSILNSNNEHAGGQAADVQRSERK